ncbi:MAG: four helix bundle protein [Elusimicrobiales bacterium]
MAKYEHLKVYKDFYDFSKQMLNSIRKYPKLFKYTLGSSIQEIIYEVLRGIVMVNGMEKKKEKLSELISYVELLQIQIRLSKDMNCFGDLNMYFNLSQRLTEVLKQLEGWRKMS